jgi:hypothetical protein
MSDETETDAAFRARIINAYGMWGAFCTVVLESSGADLDDCGKHVGLIRLGRRRRPRRTRRA